MRIIKGRFTTTPSLGAIVAPPKRYGLTPFKYEIVKINVKSLIIQNVVSQEKFVVMPDEKTTVNVFAPVN